MRRLQFLVALSAHALACLVLGCAPGDSHPPAGPEEPGEARSALGEPMASEIEPNGTAESATPIAKDGVIAADIFLIGDEDLFSFSGTAGERVYASTATAFSPTSSDSLLDLLGPDGITVLESDNDNGSIATAASSIAGAPLAETGTHYLRVRQAGGSSTIRPYHLHVKTQLGDPTPEVEPNDLFNQAQPLPVEGWVSGDIDPVTDVDTYAVTLEAGDTVFASLDLDPDRDGTEFNGTLSMGPFAGSNIAVDDAGGAGPDSEALFATVKAAGVYGISVGSSGGTGNYHLSVSVHPAAQANCTTYSSLDGPLTIPDGPGQITSTITIPGNPRVADVRVSLGIHHPSPQDLDVSLQSPAGTQALLFTDVGNPAFPDLDITLDDEAAFPISAVYALNGLVVQPEPAFRLDWFRGQDAGGTWTLRVVDDAASNTGTLESWSITICEPPPAPSCKDGNVAAMALWTDFEAGPDGFTHTGSADTWAHGTPTQAPGFTDCHSGTKCFKTNLSGSYSANASQDLVSPPIDLVGSQGPIVASWAMKYQMENAQFDPAWIDVREVGGANPRRLWQWTGYTMSNDLGGLPVQEIAGWGVYTADISAYAGKTVELVFHLQSDTTGQYPGLAIDDVRVTACPAQVCGNGAIEGDEQCDDGNAIDGDGCSAFCTTETQTSSGGAGGTTGSSSAGGSSGAGGLLGAGGAGGNGDASGAGGTGGASGPTSTGTGGTGGAPIETECGCRFAGDDDPGAPWAPAVALLGLGLSRLRRRRARA